MKYAILILCILASAANAQHVRIFATAIGNDSAGAFMGGSSNGSGLYQSDDTGKTWKHLGWNNLKTYSMDMVRSSNGKILYAATGLGVLRSSDFGETWRQLTDWRISEVMDIAVDQKHPDTIYIATAHGPWRSRDGGKSWQELMNGLSVPYCSRVVVDSVRDGHILLASEVGIFTLERDSEWRQVPSDQRGITNQKEHPARSVRFILQIGPGFWIGACENSRVLLSSDSGKMFGTPSYGGVGLWCADRIGVKYPVANNFVASWGVTVMGAARGVYLDGWDDDVGNGGYSDSIRNVHACIAILDTGATGWHEYVTLFGALGEGAFVYNKRARESRSGIGNISSPGRDMVGDQKLPGRQIWTLKSYLVSP